VETANLNLTDADAKTIADRAGIVGAKFEISEMTPSLIGAAERYVARYTGSFEFIVDLKNRQLSPGQAKGALNCLLAAVRRDAKPIIAPAAGEDFASIPAFLCAAATNLKWPKFHFKVDEREYVLRLKGAKAKRPWSIDIVSRDKPFLDSYSGMPAAEWFGRILADGTMEPSKRLTAALLDALRLIAADPKNAAIKYGRLTSSCSFCGRLLETKESVSVGYGPICADKYNLPWGEISEFAVA